MLLRVMSLAGQSGECSSADPGAGTSCARQLDAPPAGADAGDAAYRPKALLPFMKRLPARRVVRPPAPHGPPDERCCVAQ